MAEKHLNFGTLAIHGGLSPDKTTGAVMTPVYQTSTFARESVDEHKGYAYSRTQNPTREALEKNIAAIEGVSHAACFGSGMAATDAVLRLLSPGDEVIATNDLYGGTYRIFKTVYERYGVVFRFVSMHDVKNVRDKINDKTKLIWIETPTNPMTNIIDIAAVSKAATAHNVLTVVDNTFATPYLQRPAELGADIIMHSATKYLGGHSDVVSGALACDDDSLAVEIKRIQNTTGAVPGPMDCFLTLRGIKTLHVRMERHCENAGEIAQFLQQHPGVESVHWPGLNTHPGHHLAKKQMRNFGGMLSFSLKEDTLEAAKEVLNRTKVFTLAESLGGVESLIGHPATMTHAAIPKNEREKAGITDSLIRLSVGIEDAQDLIADLKQALDASVNK